MNFYQKRVRQEIFGNRCQIQETLSDMKLDLAHTCKSLSYDGAALHYLQSKGSVNLGKFHCLLSLQEINLDYNKKFFIVEEL